MVKILIKLAKYITLVSSLCLGLLGLSFLVYTTPARGDPWCWVWDLNCGEDAESRLDALKINEPNEMVIHYQVDHYWLTGTGLNRVILTLQTNQETIIDFPNDNHLIHFHSHNLDRNFWRQQQLIWEGETDDQFLRVRECCY